MVLQAQLPCCLELVQVTGGYAVLACKGLYEVQLSLFQQPYPVQVAEARQSAGAATADPALQPTLQEQLVSGEVPAAQDLAKQQQVQVRWQWTLTHAVMLPNAANKLPLRQVQMDQLLRAVRERMWFAADAAAVEAAKQSSSAAKGAAGAEQQPPVIDGAVGDNPQGTLSSLTGQHQPAASTAAAGSTLSGMSAGAAPDFTRGLDLERYKADEVTLPLLVMHGVLRDVSAQILLHDVRLAAERLTQPGSRWEQHLQLSRSEVLTPGIRLRYWQKVAVLLPAPPPAGAAAAVGGSSAAAAGAGEDAAGLTAPAIEVGIGSDGTVQVVHLPALQHAGALSGEPLVLDSHSVDVEGLLLQAVSVTATYHLQLIQQAVEQVLKQKGLQSSVQLQLSCFGQAVDDDAPVALLTSGAAEAEAAVQHVPPGAAPIERGVAAGCSAASSSCRGVQPSSGAVAMPACLVMTLDGQRMVSVSLQPWSGRVVLRPGSAYGGERNMEMGISLHQVRRGGALDGGSRTWWPLVWPDLRGREGQWQSNFSSDGNMPWYWLLCRVPSAIGWVVKAATAAAAAAAAEWGMVAVIGMVWLDACSVFFMWLAMAVVVVGVLLY
jgi:hypothetical protein